MLQSDTNTFTMSPQIKMKSPKKKRWVPQRDSLAHRKRHGKPGSKRYKRYINAAYLNDVDFWDMPIDEIFREQEMISWCPEYTSFFEYLLEDVDYPGIWEPFTFITEEKQEELLFVLCDRRRQNLSKKSKATPSNMDITIASAQTNFLKVDKNTRKLLKKSFNMRLVQCLEFKLLNFFVHSEENWRLSEVLDIYDEDLINDTQFYCADWISSGNQERSKSSGNELHILLKNSRDRKVAHGVCTFYGLLSIGENRTGERITVIWKPKQIVNQSLPIPKLLLSSYLQSKSAGK